MSSRPRLCELLRTPLRRSSPMKSLAPVQGPNPVSGVGRKHLFAVGGHSALCISIHRCYKVFGPGKGHTTLRRVFGRLGPGLMHVSAYELPRISIPRTPVNKALVGGT